MPGHRGVHRRVAGRPAPLRPTRLEVLVALALLALIVLVTVASVQDRIWA